MSDRVRTKPEPLKLKVGSAPVRQRAPDAPALADLADLADSPTQPVLPPSPARDPASPLPPIPNQARPLAGSHDATVGLDPAPPKTLGEQPGDEIDRWRLIRKIGEGGFGSIWLAERRDPIVQRVALKIIKPGMDSEEVIARFEQERQALAMMEHPHIARVLDAGTTSREMGARPYFVMEHVKGEPITAFCDRHRLTVRRRLELFIQACDAVRHAHAKGVIHRDLKPSNILVAMVDAAGSDASGDSAPRAGEPIVKVIDFGIAKALSGALTDRAILTEHGRLLGTPEYMSPEQADASDGEVDARSDVYALGVVLYELLAGALPMDPDVLRSGGFDQIRRLIREFEPPRPSDRLAGLDASARARIGEARRIDPDELAALLRRELEWIPLMAMRKDAARRYPAAADLEADIRNYLRGRSLRAGPERWSYRARKALHRRLGRAGCAGLAWLVAAALGIAAADVGAPATAGVWTQQARQSLFGFDLEGKAFEHVRIIRRTSRTDVDQLARAQFSAGELADKRVLRLLHARLLERLSRADVRSVAFDIQFNGPSKFDRFLGDCADLRPGADVVFGAAAWDSSLWSDAAPDDRPIRVGGLTANRTEAGDIDVELAVLRPQASRLNLLSLALGSLAARLAPAATPTVQQRGHDCLLLDLGGAARAPVLIGTSGVLEETQPGLGIQPGDKIAYLPIFVPPDQAIQQACIEYADVFGASNAQLRAWFSGRSVVVCDDTDEHDRFVYSDGRRVGGYVVQAQAIEALIRCFAWRERWWADAALGAIAGAAGLLIGSVRIGSIPRAALGACSLLAVAVLPIFALDSLGLLTSPVGGASAMLAALGLARWLTLDQR